MRLCVFGDSFVNGTADPERLGWLGRATAGARAVTVYNLGVRGDTSSDIRARWRQEMDRRLTSADETRLIFAFGANDCCPDDTGDDRRVTRADTLANTAAILGDASARWPTLMIGPPPIADEAVNARIEDLTGALGATSARFSVPYCDLFGALHADDIWMRDVAAWDGAHPGADGYAVLAQLVTAWPAWREWFPVR